VTESIAFDRAAEYYDRTRALPPEVQAQVTAFLCGELGQGRVLEVGVGTGRMAIPVVAAGVEVVGVDLSEPMLRRLRVNASGAAAVPAARADALKLPFPGRSFAAAYLCHVLHLIPDWRGAVAELVRVVSPGGRLLIDLGGHATERGRAIGAFFERAAGSQRLRPGVSDPADLEAALVGLGCVLLEPATIPMGIDYTVAEILQRLESNEWSRTWSLSEDVRLRAVAETRTWAEGRWGDLGAPVHEDSTIVWRRFETPATPVR
jgi:SAM-dependent methyltransferase